MPSSYLFTSDCFFPVNAEESATRMNSRKPIHTKASGYEIKFDAKLINFPTISLFVSIETIMVINDGIVATILALYKGDFRVKPLMTVFAALTNKRAEAKYKTRFTQYCQMDVIP